MHTLFLERHVHEAHLQFINASFTFFYQTVKLVQRLGGGWRGSAGFSPREFKPYFGLQRPQSSRLIAFSHPCVLTQVSVTKN